MRERERVHHLFCVGCVCEREGERERERERERCVCSGVAKILCQGGPIDKNKITPQTQLTNAYIILQMHISRRSFKTY